MRAHLFNNMTIIDTIENNGFKNGYDLHNNTFITDGDREYPKISIPEEYKNVRDSSRHLFFSDTFDKNVDLRLVQKRNVTDIGSYRIIEPHHPFPESITVDQYKKLSPAMASKYYEVTDVKETVIFDETLEIVVHDNDFLPADEATDVYLLEKNELRSGIIYGFNNANRKYSHNYNNAICLNNLISMQTGDIRLDMGTGTILTIIGQVINNITNGDWVTANVEHRGDTYLQINFHAEKWEKRVDYIRKKKVNGGYYADGRKEKINVNPVIAGIIRLTDDNHNKHHNRQIATIPVDLGRKFTSLEEMETYISNIIDELIGDAINGPL